MDKYIINKDHAFSEFESIELDIDTKLTTQEIIIKGEALELVKISPFAFLFKKFLLPITIFLLMLVLFIFNHPLLALLYIIATFLVYITIDKFCMLKYIDTIALFSYALHAIFFFVSKDSNGLLAFDSMDSFLIIGAFSFHLLLNLLKNMYQYANIYELIEEFPTGKWYVWQNGFHCKDTK